MRRGMVKTKQYVWSISSYMKSWVILTVPAAHQPEPSGERTIRWQPHAETLTRRNLAETYPQTSNLFYIITGIFCLTWTGSISRTHLKTHDMTRFQPKKKIFTSFLYFGFLFYSRDTFLSRSVENVCDWKLYSKRPWGHHIALHQCRRRLLSSCMNRAVTVYEQAFTYYLCTTIYAYIYAAYCHTHILNFNVAAINQYFHYWLFIWFKCPKYRKWHNWSLCGFFCPVQESKYTKIFHYLAHKTKTENDRRDAIKLIIDIKTHHML